MTLVWIVASIALTAIAVDWGYRQFASSRICELIDNVPPFGPITSQPVASAEVISIPTTDDLHLTASLHSPSTSPRGLILFCPELHGSHWTVTNYCESLLKNAYAVLAFDFRNQGESEHLPGFDPIHWPTEFELADLNSVLDFIAHDDGLKHLPLGAFGVSRGGSTLLTAACRSQQIQSIVTDSAYDSLSLVLNFTHKFSRYVVPDWFFNRLPRWHVEWVVRQAMQKSEQKRGGQRECRYLHLTDEITKLTQPILLISGKRDSYVTPAVTQNLATVLNREDSIWMVPKAKHNKSRSVAQEEYDQRLIDHFHRTLQTAPMKHQCQSESPLPQP